MPDQVFTSAAEAQRRLDALDTQMSSLLAAAVGRGLTPPVGPELAQIVADEWAVYREWRDTLGGVTLTLSYVSELEQWTQRANAIRARLAAAGAAVRPPLTEWRQAGPAHVLQGAGAVIAAVGLIWLLQRGGRD